MVHLGLSFRADLQEEDGRHIRRGFEIPGLMRRAEMVDTAFDNYGIKPKLIDWSEK
jgi:hypothetical protein